MPVLHRLSLSAPILALSLVGCGKDKGPTAQEVQAEIAILERMEKEREALRDEFDAELNNVREALSSDILPILLQNSPAEKHQEIKQREEAGKKRLAEKQASLEKEYQTRSESMDDAIKSQRKRVSDLNQKRNASQ